jgi:FAD dependent oxidoreductase TIGR03364
LRNFGSVWPIGVADHIYERALRSRSIWLELLRAMRIWHEPCGSLHVARASDEMAVLEAYVGNSRGARPCQVLSAAAARARVPALIPEGLHGGLWCEDELLLDPREALRALPAYLAERHGVRFRWATAVNSVDSGVAYAGRARFAAERIYICGGADFEWLYPEVFAAAPLTRCKVQMMRLTPEAGGFRLGPSLAAGLSLVHYAAFAAMPEVAPLRARLEREQAPLLEAGIHMLVMQNGQGELAVGDSHAYGHTPDPFDECAINEKILGYTRQVVNLPAARLTQTWHGIYAKLTDGGTEFVRSAAPGVTIVNGLGGLGMTLAFGLAEELVDGRYRACA